MVFSGVILTHKQNENNTSLKLLTDSCVGLEVGNLIDWNDSKWLVWYKTISSYQPHDKFEIIRCNNTINWLDEDGILHSSPCHVVSSQESKVKENFRTWNELITPQPNKYLEVIMPYQYIAKNTEIIIFDEVWRLVEYDKTSVPGIIYMSFTETKVNELTDDLNQSLANADKIQTWSIQTPEQYTVSLNSSFVPSYTLVKDGIKQETDTKPIIMVGEGLILQEDGTVLAISELEEPTSIVLMYENVMKEVPVVISAIKKGYINGDDYIRITRGAKYIFSIDDFDASKITKKKDKKGVEKPFFVNNEVLAWVDSYQDNECIVMTNENNKLGSFVLSIEYDGQIYEKEIRIISLWQVI